MPSSGHGWTTVRARPAGDGGGASGTRSCGYYISWRKAATESAPASSSRNCHISQLAGAWWAHILGLPSIVDPGRWRRAMGNVHRWNVAPVSGCPADEAEPGGRQLQSMAALTVAYFAAHSIVLGLPDEGWEGAERVYRVRYELDGCPGTSRSSGPGRATSTPSGAAGT